jgi:two-component system, OmpR family, response regulator
MRILVVEDEKKVQRFITQALEGAGMVVDTVGTLPDMLASLEAVTFDAIVLDRLLAGHDSLTALGEVRRLQPHAKVLVLSALAEVEDKVQGLTQGADDYLGKPFHVAELVARLRTLLRREAQAEKPGRDTVLAFEDLTIDLEKQRVARGERRIDLTGKEFRILCLLARHPGQIFSKAAILDQVWDLNHFPESNIVEVTIANLRSKVDKGFKPLIKSRRGVGYWLGEA